MQGLPSDFEHEHGGGCGRPTRDEGERHAYLHPARRLLARHPRGGLDGDTVSHVDFVGGCDGNLKAISKLIQGMTVDQVAEQLEGNTCGRRSTSCADQLVHALREAQGAQGV